MPDQYDGLIPRQRLVDFVRAQTRPKQVDSGQLYETIEDLQKIGADTDTDLIHTIHSLNEQIMENSGYQKAMRDVGEWAKGNKVSQNPEMVLCNDECIGSHYHEKEDDE